jgi:ABC-2 type transport system permease protein
VNSALTIARMELTDTLRGRFSRIVLTFLVLTMISSIIVASTSFGVKMDEFLAYSQALMANGNQADVPAPQLFPLQLMRGSLEYLEVLGALFAILIGYAAVAKEKQRGTLNLVFSRPIGRFALWGGKTLALAIFWIGFALITYLLTLSVVVIVGHAQLAGMDLVRVVLVVAATWVYLMFWTSLSMAITALSRNHNSALVIAIALWLLVVLIVPQIGDTMDPDNQVPGGLFNSLQIAKADENAVLDNFAAYNNARDSLEVSSVTKHFERFVFGFFGIKDKYNQQPISMVWTDLSLNAFVLFAFALASQVLSFISIQSKTLLRTSK